MIGLNGNTIQGAYVSDKNASLPQSVSYENIRSMQSQLKVPQTAPSMTTSNGLAYSVEKINGVWTYVVENPHGEWKDSEIMSPPEEYLAKKDIERQKAIERKMMDNLSDEQKKLLKKLEDGELFGKSKLIEENKNIKPYITQVKF